MARMLNAPCEGIVYLRNYYWELYAKHVIDCTQVEVFENLTQSIERDIEKGFSPERKCHNASNVSMRWKCSECGTSFLMANEDKPMRFCVGCGARAVSE